MGAPVSYFNGLMTAYLVVAAVVGLIIVVGLIVDLSRAEKGSVRDIGDIGLVIVGGLFAGSIWFITVPLWLYMRVYDHPSKRSPPADPPKPKVGKVFFRGKGWTTVRIPVHSPHPVGKVLVALGFYDMAESDALTTFDDDDMVEYVKGPDDVVKVYSRTIDGQHWRMVLLDDGEEFYGWENEKSRSDLFDRIVTSSLQLNGYERVAKDRPTWWDRIHSA